MRFLELPRSLVPVSHQTMGPTEEDSVPGLQKRDLLPLGFPVGVDGGPGMGQPVTNVATAYFTSANPQRVDSMLFVNGFLKIVGDAGAFRGDTNGDDMIDLSDPLTTLNFLFLGTGEIASSSTLQCGS